MRPSFTHSFKAVSGEKQVCVLKTRYVFKSPVKRILVFLLDATGNFLAAPFKRRRPAYDPADFKKILILRLDHLGDVIMTRPSAAILRQAFPQAEIHWLVSPEAQGLLSRDKTIDTVLTMDQHWFSRNKSLRQLASSIFKTLKTLRKNRYDLAIDFRGDARNIALMAFSKIPWRLAYSITGGQFLLTHQMAYPWNCHQVERNRYLLRALEISQPVCLKPFAVLQTDREALETILNEMEQDRSGSKMIVIHPGAGYPSKRWPSKYFLDLIEKLGESGHGPIAVIGTQEEKDLLNLAESRFADQILDLRGSLPLAMLPALFERTILYIGNDSGPAHLAASQGLPGVCIFSAVNRMSEWGPYSERFQTITRILSCSPCESRVCPLQHHQCMRDISVDEVFKAAIDLLENPHDALPYRS